MPNYPQLASIPSARGKDLTIGYRIEGEIIGIGPSFCESYVKDSEMLAEIGAAVMLDHIDDVELLPIVGSFVFGNGGCGLIFCGRCDYYKVK